MPSDAQYAKLKKEIRDECARILAERLHGLDLAFGKVKAVAPSGDNGHAQEAPKTLGAAVRLALARLPQKFSSNELRQVLAKDFPDIKYHGSTLSHLMAEFNDREELVKIAQKGIGKKPAQYEKI